MYATSPFRDQKQATLADDVECLDWLQEIDLPQYAETLIVNCGFGGALLSRHKLARIRLKDLPKMNITNYDHQKLLLSHIEHTLNYTFLSPMRKREVFAKMGKPMEELGKPLFGSLGDGKKSKNKSNISSRRRRSFDTAAWNSISKLRNVDTTHKVAADHLRAIHGGEVEHLAAGSEEKKVRRRRRSFDPNTSNSASKSNAERGREYGNMAHLFDMIRAEMAELTAEVLQYFRDLIKCEEVQILFVDDKTSQLMLQFNSMWYRMPLDSGLAGHCYTTGEVVNVGNCYKDPRFNRRLDEKTGFKTKNCLCMPVRGRGSGNIVAVVQMLNKCASSVATAAPGTASSNPMASPQTPNARGESYETFDRHDEDTLALCCQRVSDDLSDRFAELLLVGEQFCGCAILVPGGRNQLEAEYFGTGSRRHYDHPTTASKNYESQTSAEFGEKFNASAAKKRLDMSFQDSVRGGGSATRPPEDLRVEFSRFNDV